MAVCKADIVLAGKGAESFTGQQEVNWLTGYGLSIHETPLQKPAFTVIHFLQQDHSYLQQGHTFI